MNIPTLLGVGVRSGGRRRVATAPQRSTPTPSSVAADRVVAGGVAADVVNPGPRLSPDELFGDPAHRPEDWSAVEAAEPGLGEIDADEVFAEEVVGSPAMDQGVERPPTEEVGIERLPPLAGGRQPVGAAVGSCSRRRPSRRP